MHASSFETELRTDGFGEIVNGDMKPNEVRKVHAHDYEVRGLVLEGGIVLTCGSEERSFGLGEVFTMRLAAIMHECGPAAPGRVNIRR